MISDFVARVTVQQALRGKTLAGTRVLNSPMVALKDIVDSTSHFQPVIVVASSDYSSDITGHDLHGGNATSKMTITVMMPPSGRIDFNGRQYDIPATGPFHAALGDIIIGQIVRALLDYENPWARLWPRIAHSIAKMSKSPPYLEAEESLAIPARVLMLEYRPIADPAIGRPMSDTYRAFHDLMAADNGMKALAPLFKGAIEDPAEVPDWAFIIMQLGLPDVAATNTGIRPLVVDGDPLEEVGRYFDDPEDDGEIVAPTTNEGAPEP
jgi:hypothetical protein